MIRLLCMLLALVGTTTVGHSEPAQPPALIGCNLDVINGAQFSVTPPKVATDKALSLIGWVVNPRSDRVPLKVRLRLLSENGATLGVPVRHRAFRPDVAQYLKKDAYGIAGFIVTVPSMTLVPGLWRVSMVYRVEDEDVACDSRQSIVVTAAKTP